MKILFAFENPLPSREADAEVFVTTARYLARLADRAWLHVPLPDATTGRAAGILPPLELLRAHAPLRPAALRHLCCGLALVLRPEFRQADLIYTRNLWIASVALLFGQRVAFDHYRPWSDQIPPLRLWLYRLICRKRFLVNFCHSDYTRRAYLALGVPVEKVLCVRNGFEPERLAAPMPLADAKLSLGIAADRTTVVYTGRLNHKKGLYLVIEAAKRLPEVLFILVGSGGDGPIERSAASLDNIRIVAWQPPDALARFLFAADMLLIPPSRQPLAEFGSTVLPLKLFFYMASGRPILAGDTPDVAEVLEHRRNAWLCHPDSANSLVDGIRSLSADPCLATRLASAARADRSRFTWAERARTISAVLERRLHAADAAPGSWSREQSRAWGRGSWRWLVHLVRTRSWILPPRPSP